MFPSWHKRFNFCLIPSMQLLWFLWPVAAGMAGYDPESESRQHVPCCTGRRAHWDKSQWAATLADRWTVKKSMKFLWIHPLGSRITRADKSDQYNALDYITVPKYRLHTPPFATTHRHRRAFSVERILSRLLFTRTSNCLPTYSSTAIFTAKGL